MSDEYDEDNETWLLNAGHRVIEKMTAEGYSSLIALDRLIYCLWAADYGMRNAGDLETTADPHPTCLDDGKAAAQELALPRSAAAFSLYPENSNRRILGCSMRSSPRFGPSKMHLVYEYTP